MASCTLPVGSRLVSVAVRQPDGSYAPLDEDRVYGVVTNNFLRQGGDAYTVLRDRAIDPYDGGPNLEEVMEAYLRPPQPPQPPARRTDRRGAVRREAAGGVNGQ
ncbi:MAG: 5'-nucleotidase C-terminal domain-containing protein [Acetobacteraceae bacterium]|nr:5'-nucleotidase C-terminal domain-containing protein [Acetobacteraceae bacterium]